MKRISIIYLLLSVTFVTFSQTIAPDLSWLNTTNGTQPKYVWENREDAIYHELYYPDTLKQTAPEFWALMRCPWVFNRAMQWQTVSDNVIAYCTDGNLQLTGEKQVSAWYSDPENKISSQADFTTFEKLNAKRQRDCAVLPSFQFHIGQNPILHLEVAKATSQWQFVISIKGRSGVPIICSGWQSGSKTMNFDIATALLKAGYKLNFAELHFVMGTWDNSATVNHNITFKVQLLSQPAIVACLPIIKTAKNAQQGINVNALLTNIQPAGIKLFASLNGKKYEMTSNNNTYRCSMPAPAEGSYTITFSSNNTAVCNTSQLLRITNGIYYSYKKEKNYFEKDGKPEKPLTGSYQGCMFYKDCGLKSEQLINSQTEWDSWDRTEAPGEHLHSWESWTEAEMHNRFAYLAQNNWSLLHLHSHYGIWERFDAVGNLAPHGIEQFANYVKVAAQNNLWVMITLSSYPYGFDQTEWDKGTAPYFQYKEKGFKNDDWYNPQNEPFRSIYHQYMRSFITLFKDESSIFSLSSSGEGDWKVGYKRFADTKEVIKSIDTMHVVVSEPIMHFTQLPRKQVEGFTSDVVGYRNYAMGAKINSDEEMGMYVRIAQMLPNSFISEGSFPSNNLYTHICFPKGNPEQNCWTGTENYRRYNRDWLYFGFIAQMPALVTWDEVLTENERIVMHQVSRQVNWNETFVKPKVAILVNDTLVTWDGRELIAKYERVFSKLAIDYSFIDYKSETAQYKLIINPLNQLKLTDAEIEKAIPAEIRQTALFKSDNAHAVHFFQTENTKTTVAYIYNTATHVEQPFYLTGKHQRMPQPAALTISSINLPKGKTYQLFDLDTKTIVAEGIINPSTLIKTVITNHDYLLFVK